LPATLEGAAGTVALLLSLALPISILLGGVLFVPRRAAFWSLERARLAATRHRAVLLGMLGVLALAIVQTQIDPAVTAALGWDFTPTFRAIEGDVHLRLQQAFDLPALTFLLAVVYVIGFPVFTQFTVLLFVWLDAKRLAERAFAAFALCYVLALPFYLFFPVSEVWTVGEARNLALFHPAVEAHLYAFNEVGNCFPSLHTAMSVALAAVAWQSGHRAYARFGAVLATLIVVSTILLGIHWITDVVAGLALAALVVVLVDRFLPQTQTDRISA